MLGVGGLSFSLGMGSSEMMGLTEKAGSKKDSLNFPFTLAPLEQKNEKMLMQTSRYKTQVSVTTTVLTSYLRLIFLCHTHMHTKPWDISH